MDRKYEEFVKEISRKIDKKRIYTDALRTLAWGTDAGFYRLLPKVVVRAADEDEVSFVLRTAAALKLPVQASPGRPFQIRYFLSRVNFGKNTEFLMTKLHELHCNRVL